MRFPTKEARDRKPSHCKSGQGSPTKRAGLHSSRLAACVLALALILVGGARGDVVGSALTLGSVTIEDGTVVVNGAVEDVDALLEVNGMPVDIDDSGNFLAVVGLDGDTLVLELAEGLGESTTIRIPIAALIENGGEGILNDLLDAGTAIDVPVDGFEVVDANGPIVSGNVVNADLLDSMTINGINVLSNLGPNGGFFIVLPWTSAAPPSQQVTVVVVDRRGVSQTTKFRTTKISSVIRTRAGMSVSAAGARGVIIAKIRFEKNAMKWNKRLGVSVTVKDRRGHLVRGAALRLTGTPARYLAAGSVRSGFTNRLGQARFAYRLHPRAFAACGCKQFVVTARASTLRAWTKKTANTRLPALARS